MSEEDYQRGRRGGSFRAGGDFADWKEGSDDYDEEQRRNERERERRDEAETAAILADIARERREYLAGLSPDALAAHHAREAQARADAEAARSRAQAAEARACDLAANIAKIGMWHTQWLWDEAQVAAKKAQDGRGRFMRLFSPAAAPSTQYIVHLRVTAWESRQGRWIQQPVLIIGILHPRSRGPVGMKHYRFATPQEYVAAVRQIETMHPGLASSASEIVRRFGPALSGDWSTHFKPVSETTLHRRDLELSATNGHAAAQYELGRANANGTPPNYAAALEWYRRAASQGHAGACRNIGLMYRYGQAVTADYAEARKSYERAWELGDPQAMNRIGDMFFEGLGVSQDYDLAIGCYRRAAEKGDSSGQFSLGWAYHRGRGVVQNDGEALRWFRRAAAQGHDDATIYIDLITGKFDP